MAVITHPVPLPAALRQGVDPHVGIGAGVQGLGAKGLHSWSSSLAISETREGLIPSLPRLGTSRSTRRVLTPAMSAWATTGTIAR